MATSRENRLLKRLMATRIACTMLTIALIVFVCMFVNELKTTEQTYLDRYKKAITSTTEKLDDCTNNPFDYDRKYRDIIGDVGLCREFVFLADLPQDQKNIMNKLYYVFVKVPNQAKLNMEAITAAFKDIDAENSDKGYEALKSIIENIDTEDF